MIATSTIVLLSLVLFLLFLLIFISIGSNNAYKKHQKDILTYQKDILTYQDRIIHFKQEISKLKKEANAPKSQEFINFLSDFQKEGGLLHIEPINKNDIYYHNAGK